MLQHGNVAAREKHHRQEHSLLGSRAAASHAALAPSPWEPAWGRRRHGWGFPTLQLFPPAHEAKGNYVSKRKVRSVLRSQAAGWILMELS